VTNWGLKMETINEAAGPALASVLMRWERETGWAHVGRIDGATRSTRFLPLFIQLADPRPDVVRQALRQRCGALWVHVRALGAETEMYEAAAVVAVPTGGRG
jgi:hypothetical protein